MSASDLGLPETVHGPDYRASRFALLTGRHTCYKCDRLTRVSAIGLAGYEEREREYGEPITVDDTVLLTGIYALNAQAATEVASRAPWMRLAHSHTAGQAYLANHCEHCDAMIGAWYIQEPGEAFFPLTQEELDRLAIEWIEVPIQAEDNGGAMSSWQDVLWNGQPRPA